MNFMVPSNPNNCKDCMKLLFLEMSGRIMNGSRGHREEVSCFGGPSQSSGHGMQ